MRRLKLSRGTLNVRFQLIPCQEYILASNPESREHKMLVENIKAILKIEVICGLNFHEEES